MNKADFTVQETLQDINFLMQRNICYITFILTQCYQIINSNFFLAPIPVEVYFCGKFFN